MDKIVYVKVDGDEYSLGTVKEVLSGESSKAITRLIQDICENLVYDDVSDYAVLTLEIQ